jgi:hypothetical protein
MGDNIGDHPVKLAAMPCGGTTSHCRWPALLADSGCLLVTLPSMRSQFDACRKHSIFLAATCYIGLPDTVRFM